MDVTAREIERIPPGNVRVPLAEFVRIWATAEQVCDDRDRKGICDWYTAGVAMTCRWLATAVVPSLVGGRQLAWAPVTMRTAQAHEELIEAECLAAERLAIRNPGGVAGQPGWLEAIVTTLNWAWRGSGVPPLDVTHAAAG